MRVISGELGGRQFDSPRGHRTHPMSEKARGGLFNALGDIEGLKVLDAFAGSGAITIEAISRGAAKAMAVEIDKDAHLVIQSNLKQLNLTDKVKAVRANVGSWSEINTDAIFDLVICDPPYDKNSNTLINKLTKHVKTGGLIVISHPPSVKYDLSSKNFEHISDKSYGDAQLAFYRRTG